MKSLWYGCQYVCVCVCLCVHPPGYEKPFMCNEAGIINQTSPTAFQSACMALSINITDGHGLSNEAHH